MLELLPHALITDLVCTRRSQSCLSKVGSEKFFSHHLGKTTPLPSGTDYNRSHKEQLQTGSPASFDTINKYNIIS